MQNRRKFIGQSVLATADIGFPDGHCRFTGRRRKKLTILHTNDVHSRLEPLPDGRGGENARGAGRRGCRAERSRIRGERIDVLLLDAGISSRARRF